MKMSHQPIIVHFTDPEESSAVRKSRSLMNSFLFLLPVESTAGLLSELGSTAFYVLCLLKGSPNLLKGIVCFILKVLPEVIILNIDRIMISVEPLELLLSYFLMS